MLEAASICRIRRNFGLRHSGFIRAWVFRHSSLSGVATPMGVGTSCFSSQFHGFKLLSVFHDHAWKTWPRRGSDRRVPGLNQGQASQTTPPGLSRWFKDWKLDQAVNSAVTAGCSHLVSSPVNHRDRPGGVSASGNRCNIDSILSMFGGQAPKRRPGPSPEDVAPLGSSR